jgi:hypothetical protein
MDWENYILNSFRNFKPILYSLLLLLLLLLFILTGNGVFTRWQWHCSKTQHTNTSGSRFPSNATLFQ